MYFRRHTSVVINYNINFFTIIIGLSDVDHAKADQTQELYATNQTRLLYDFEISRNCNDYINVNEFPYKVLNCFLFLVLTGEIFLKSFGKETKILYCLFLASIIF